MSPHLDASTDIEHVTAGPAFEALGLVHRVRVPPGEGPHPTLVMIHGLNGNEDVTWVFARAASPDWLIVSPRAPFPGDGGYRWSNLTPEGKTDAESLRSGLDSLARFIEGLADVYPVDRSRMVLLGFSQGCAMSYAYAVSHPVRGIAALSGFIPPQVKDKLPALKGLPILIIHGIRDETISIETARKNRDELIEVEAKVAYHESDVGHKVSSTGMAELKQWLMDRLAEGE